MPETYVDKKGFRRIKETNQLFSKWLTGQKFSRGSHKEENPPGEKENEPKNQKRHWEKPKERMFK